MYDAFDDAFMTSNEMNISFHCRCSLAFSYIINSRRHPGYVGVSDNTCNISLLVSGINYIVSLWYIHSFHYCKGRLLKSVT